ncbi:hypothetical protein [Stenotrophomonas maltophilia]|uniref:hypothetical protein n=1 Tax=Stenotrophomonas maltophilia TaxID=40324 RepID=UPI002E762073|nr:hypothetical protein [Stenotrophomonas maltophilia]
MAKKWVEVASSPAYQALAPEQQEEARNQYWNEVVAPNVPVAEQAQVRQAFDSDTSRTVNWPGQDPLDVDVTGGAPEPADFSGVTSSISSTADGRQADGWMPGAGRDFAFGVRSALQGAGSLLGAVGGDAFNNYVANPVARAVGLQESRPYREEAAALADRLGLPKAQTGTDRVLGDVGEALTGTGLTLGIGGGINALANVGRSAAARTPAYVAPVENRLASFLTAQPAMQTVSAATGAGASSVARESGASQGNQLLAGLAGSLGPGLAMAGGAATLRGAVRGSSGEQMRNRLADFEALGANPSVGQASGNALVQGAENLLAQAPTSAGVMARAAERQSSEISQGLRGIADDLSRNASGERAGRAIERGAETFAKNVNAQKRALYWQADRFIPESTPVGLTNTMQTVQKLTTPMPGAVETTGSLINPRIAALQQNLAADLQAGGGQIPYSALKRIRTDIGEQISDFSLSPETPTRELKQLYASLSRDMEAAAQSQGPQAVSAAKRANNYTRAAADRLEQVQRVIDKNGGGEAIYRAAMSGTRDGGTTLRAVMQSLPQDGQKAVTSAVIKRMGLANPGAQDAAGEAFSARTFLTNWNNVSPEARRALFDRYGEGFSKQIDQLARVADNIDKGASVFKNPPGTAKSAAALAYAGALVTSLWTGGTAPLLAAGVGANGAARWLTNPKTVRMLANATTLPKSQIPAFLNYVAQEGQKTGDEDVQSLASALRYAEQEVANSANDGNNAQNRD